MFLYQVYATRYSASSKLSAHIVVKDESAQIQIELSDEEKSELDMLGQRVFARHQAALAAKMAQPLEVFQLPAPEPIEEADYTEVQF